MGRMNEAVLGCSVPPDTPHAISVSLPTWRDNVGYEEGDRRVIDCLTTGYPRFFIHLSIRKLAGIVERKYAVGNEQCMLFASKTVAEQCRGFIQRRAEIVTGKPASARLVDLLFSADGNGIHRKPTPPGTIELHVVLFPREAFPVAKEFWQHTGQGISSRYAERCLFLMPKEPALTPRPSSPVQSRYTSRGFNKHYGMKTPMAMSSTPSVPQPSETGGGEDIDKDQAIYLEERYGRNLPLSEAVFAKRALRRRVAGVLLCDVPDCQSTAGQEDLVVGPSSRGVKDVSDTDVYLYPSGMTAIWSAHQLALNALGPAKSVCFGFPYTDTLKILQKWGPGCHFLGDGLDSDIDELEKILEAATMASETTTTTNTRPIVALFTEFPSNPLLRSADLRRLRALADKYDFLIVIDETIGNLVNVNVVQYADVVVSSLTKVFSGGSNVMGGSLILNPQGRHYSVLKTKLSETFEDIYFNEDALYMERNSRDFKKRIQTINRNADAVCTFLHGRSLSGGAHPNNAVIKEVFYPKFTTPEHYEHCRITHSEDGGHPGGYGGLFSLTFTSDDASRVFFDTLECYKGPSLGTNFTLACPFTILAHYTELDWAAQFGVEAGLVRVSVGLEEAGTLLERFERALVAAERAVRAEATSVHK